LRLLVATTAYPLPERDGLDLLTAGLLRELQSRHEILLLAIVKETDDLERHREICRDLVAVHEPRTGRWGRLHQELVTTPTRRPILAEQATEALSGPVSRAIHEFKPDLVHLIQPWTAELALRAPGLPTVLSALDASSPNWEERIAHRRTVSARYLARRELSRMLNYERTVFPLVSRVVLVTEHDSSLVRTQSPRSRVATITNGIDAHYWRRPEGTPRDPGLVVFTGALSYPPNVSAAVFAAHEVLPRLREKVPNAHLRLVGRDPASEVRSLAGSQVEVTGTVADLRPHLWEASAYVCPMTGGSGVKNKLLEALASGCPSVATSRATLGLDIEDGVHLLVRESAQALADGLGELLDNATFAQRLSLAGTARARDLSWAAAAQSYEKIYEEVLAER
jgi:polysaccharide biosynthesis protein PslH